MFCTGMDIYKNPYKSVKTKNFGKIAALQAGFQQILKKPRSLCMPETKKDMYILSNLVLSYTPGSAAGAGTC